MQSILQGKSIILGVTGSISCYKAAFLASKLTQNNAHVTTIMTKDAMKFVQPITFSSLTHRPVITDLFEFSEPGVEHVKLAREADLVIVAPATANTIAKMAHAMADNALTTTLLATRAPIIVAPAMEPQMFSHPGTQKNLKTLQKQGVHIAGPETGRMASGETGKGRLLEPEQLLDHAEMVLGKTGNLKNFKIVITAGGTREPIDPVRFLANRSSGKMGHSIAKAARDRGAEVILITTARDFPVHVGVHVIHVDTALEMQKFVTKECRNAHALIMSAAVADWRPKKFSKEKVKKGSNQTWELEFTRNPDILAELSQEKLIKVGFAAESENLLENARKKLEQKGLSFIVANNISLPESGFASEFNIATICHHERNEPLPRMSKYHLAHCILNRLDEYLQKL